MLKPTPQALTKRLMVVVLAVFATLTTAKPAVKAKTPQTENLRGFLTKPTKKELIWLMCILDAPIADIF
jgi:hypothetical protein